MNQYSTEIMEKLRAMKPRFAEMNIKRLRVFGSVVRGEAEPGSDVDIIVDLNEPVGLMGFSNLQRKLEDRLGVRADIVTPKGLHRALRERILKEAQDV